GEKTWSDRGLQPVVEDLATCLPAHGSLKEKDVLFLFAYLTWQNTPEAAETRRRERFATFSALSHAGYLAARPDRLYYVTVARARPDSWWQNSFWLTAPSKDAFRLPYEWFRLDPKAKADERGLYQAVCVIWVTEDFDTSDKLYTIYHLKELLDDAIKLGSHCPPRPDVAVSGRLYSDRLVSMAQDNEKSKKKYSEYLLKDVKLHISASTAQEARVKLEESNIEPTYLIQTDQVLADLLVAEFKRRNVRLGEERNDIAVIAELDTEYGRGMFPAFREAVISKLKEKNPGRKVADDEDGDVYSYSYLRGLDGKLPGEQKGGSASEQRAADDKRRSDGTAPGPTSEEGEGNPQIDYLRRLAARLKADEIHEKRQYKAIGVVGSDVYDKLLLLKALRPGFPDALFFTTDLDARLLQSGDYKHTRNLLIASHYGLSLANKLQGQTAPFRSG